MASASNDGRRTALRRVQSLYFLDRARLAAAARSRTSAIGKRILLPSAAKAISIFMEITEVEHRSPDRVKATTDSPRDLFLIAAWPNVN